MTTYWLLGKDSYDRPLPDYNQVFGTDNPQPKKLAATVGKTIRDRPSRISTDSAFFDNDGSRGPSRRTSSVEVSVLTEGRKISSEAIQEKGESEKGSPARKLSDGFVGDQAGVDRLSVDRLSVNRGNQEEIKDSDFDNNDNEAVVFGLDEVEDEHFDRNEKNSDDMWQKINVPREHNIEIIRPQTATRLVDVDESL